MQTGDKTKLRARTGGDQPSNGKIRPDRRHAGCQGRVIDEVAHRTVSLVEPGIHVRH